MKIRSTLIYVFLIFLLVLGGLFNEKLSQKLQLSAQRMQSMKQFFSASLLDLKPLTDPEIVLLMGKQGDNMDTIMLAKVDPSIKKIKLVSIPRDLYIGDKKINAYFAEDGLTRQINVVEEVSGVHVDKYVIVDLESFRKIIDLLGGIDITLTKDLVDPTYKVCENDVCTTLNYPAGTYHLNGTQVLRIARSRHTTSDYDRAERQQIIISAIKDKLVTIYLENLSDIFEIVDVSIDSVTTDLDFSAITLRMFSYRNFNVENKGVLSTSNVLSAVPVPVNYVTSHSEKICTDESLQDTCEIKYFIDTLQAKNGDMSLIKSYVYKLLSE